MESRMTELMEAIQESEGQAERRVLTLLGGRCISEKALVIDGKIVWESRKNGYFPVSYTHLTLPTKPIV